MIGITATIPLEIVLAAGRTPVDLNNLFITSGSSRELVAQAESAGFSHNICAWIKGIYSTVINHGIREIIAVTGGDCSNTIALGEILEQKGVRVIPFEYPLDRNRETLKNQMEILRVKLGATWSEIENMGVRLESIRKKLKQLDQLTYGKNVVTGSENHRFLVNSSDFNGNPDLFESELDQFLAGVRKRAPRSNEIRLGYLGVPPIFSQFYECIESLGARVVFNEVQRQFSMPFGQRDIVEQYLQYTYPYHMSARLKDIKDAINERKLDGLIHYTQTFCYRQIYDILLREVTTIPLLTLEGDRPGSIDGRTVLRIETFVEMLRAGKGEIF